MAKNSRAHVGDGSTGLDADLIMLALSTHVKHIVLIREKVIFKRRNPSADAAANRTLQLESTGEFMFLHTSLSGQGRV